jgi:hypothetical protein
MKNKVYEDTYFTILHTSRNYILIRKNGEYAQHSHFDTLGGAKLLIEFWGKKILPHNPYFAEAMRRICFPEELESFSPERQHQKYRNKRR